MYSPTPERQLAARLEFGFAWISLQNEAVPLRAT
jgi:hypothetical protein